MNKKTITYRIIDETNGDDLWNLNDPPAKCQRYWVACYIDGIQDRGPSGAIIDGEYSDYWEASRVANKLNDEDDAAYIPPDYRKKYWNR